ncbi:MAG: methyltransferase family protein [Paracoccaceae bacterium]
MHSRHLTALGYGAVCHALFGVAVALMIGQMFFGMQYGFGRVPEPWSWAVNLALALQFAVGHSALLSPPGRRLLARLAPGGTGKTLAPTTYVILASAQLFLLFALWTPSGIVWWEAEGLAFWTLSGLYGVSWLLLLKASFDAGVEVQSGLLGWTSLWRGIEPVFPDMPTTGLFRLVRQPIYVSFALTLWTVPVWTPDQLLLAVVLTGYCLIGPLFKERRFRHIFGARFDAYRARVPYWLPFPRSRREDPR